MLSHKAQTALTENDQRTNSYMIHKLVPMIGIEPEMSLVPV
jgi:hypothetical protein